MKKLVVKVSSVVFAAAMIAVASASTARAEERVFVRVPFAFIVGDVRLSAGDYVVTESSAGSGVLEVASADGQRVVYTLTIPLSSLDATTQPALVFQKFANQYFLARVDRQEGVGRQIVLTPSIMEQEIVATEKAAD